MLSIFIELIIVYCYLDYPLSYVYDIVNDIRTYVNI